MATKKSAKKKVAVPRANLAALKFRIDWIKDPMPDLRKILDRTAIRKLDALKKEFGVKVGAILKSGQR